MQYVCGYSRNFLRSTLIALAPLFKHFHCYWQICWGLWTWITSFRFIIDLFFILLTKTESKWNFCINVQTEQENLHVNFEWKKYPWSQNRFAIKLYVNYRLSSFHNICSFVLYVKVEKSVSTIWLLLCWNFVIITKVKKYFLKSNFCLEIVELLIYWLQV